MRGTLAIFFAKEEVGSAWSNYLAGKAAWRFHLTDVASLLWQVLLLPDLVTAWDKGIYRPPSCFWIISVSIVSWTVIGYKQSKLTERTWRDLALGNYLAIITSFVECGGICAFGQHLLFLKGVYHVVEVIVVHTDGQLPFQISHCYRKIHPNGSNWVSLLPWGLFSFCEENLNQYVSGDNKIIAILEVYHLLCFFSPGYFPKIKPQFLGIRRTHMTHPK